MSKHKKIKFATSRFKIKILIVLFIFILLPGLIVFDHLAGDQVRHHIARKTLFTADQKKYHDKLFRVIKVIDGDTILLDEPDGDQLSTRVRMLGIDTPETKNPKTGVMHYGPEASEYAKKLIEGKEIKILMDNVADHRCIYGRLLAYIQLQDGQILNELIIQNGYGYADLRFNHSNREKYEHLMDEAINRKTGLWKEATRNQFPSWLCQKRPTLYR